MSWFRRHLGFDGFDLTIHVGVTVMLMSVVGISNGPEELFPVMATVSLVVLAVRRKIALKSGSTGHAGLTTGEMAAERVADLEERVAELESAQSRLFELEERLDFAERLLAS
ncbi:MAG: hypothetical protein HOP28_18130, partial [Gemmatimonadales bacterium]|nr:hypothetical protein [Gemmatimonadales bacterium]